MVANYDFSGSEQTLWPEELSETSLDGHNCTEGDSWREDPNCPSAGYRQISTYTSTLRRWPGKGLFDINIQDSKLWKAVYAFEASDQTVMTATHGHLGAQSIAGRGLWTSALWYPTRSELLAPINRRIQPNAWIASYPREQKYKTKGQIPTVRVGCTAPAVQYILNRGVPGLQVLHPRLSPRPGEEPFWNSSVPFDVLEKLWDRVDLFQDPAPEQVLTHFGDWTDEINGQSLILMSPKPADSGNGTREPGSWMTIGCTLAAHWGEAYTTLTQLSSGQTYDYEKDQGFQRAEVELPPWPGWG